MNRPTLELSHATYHSLDADRVYMSSHQYADWVECAAREFARQAGKYDPPDKEAFLVGNYVDCALLTPDKFPAFLEANADLLLNNKAKKYAPIVRADEMIERAKRDPCFMLALQGEHQVIVVWEMFGVWWKAMLDVVDSGHGWLCDLKTCASFDMFEWSDYYRKKVPFYERYWPQFAIYDQAYKSRHEVPPDALAMAAITKQAPPDIDIWAFESRERFAMELADIEAKLPEVMDMKAGKIPPSACGVCDFCRAHKVLETTTIKRAESFRRRGAL